MDLADVVEILCTETFADAFTPATTFMGKLNPFSEVANSGAASQRRILETPVSETIPANRVIVTPAGEKFIVADINIDFWNGTAIRYKYPILPVDTMGSVGTVEQTLSGTQSDKAVYAYPYFVRREVDEMESSDFLSGYEISFPKNKSFASGSILKFGTRYYRLKTETWADGAGFVVAQAVLLEDPLQVRTVSSHSPNYDPNTDSYPAVTKAVLCFVEPLRQNYEFATPAFADIRAGDRAISILESAAVLKAGDSIETYQVISYRDLGTWRTYQCRNT